MVAGGGVGAGVMRGRYAAGKARQATEELNSPASGVCGEVSAV